ncbi:carnitine dehydratase [Advenella kashmirensis W13003]|uniref:Carnitine dehydratase n=1 Tax=Advenella kashmirensis W13003 TaxID=1424334 RepID=V8QUF0_9BURK|nr:CoA transferase [Advenella kashmirensis]ETF02983.1 carnitine dehydratase [Advenella kashmirensis W13003]
MTDHTQAEEDVRRAIRTLLAQNPETSERPDACLSLHGTLPDFDSRHKLAVSAASAIGAYAVTVQQWWQQCTGHAQTIDIDWMQAASSLNPGHFQTQSGYGLPALSLLTELKADFYRTRDNRWFFPIGSYPHLRDGVLKVLNCPNTERGLADAIAKWSADELEDAFAAARLPGIYARSQSEWRAHPQGSLLAAQPPIQIERIDDSPVIPASAGERPLDALRVLDMGHVIAGPVVARTLAEHGAQVLRLDPPLRQDPFRQTIDTNIGKRSAFCDLDRDEDRTRLQTLIANTDVMVQSWRPGSLEGRGFGAQQAAAIRPGIIYVSVSAYGDSGPWATRGGFEQLGQIVSGIAMDEGDADRPRLVPTYLLNDYLTGYLGATGVMMALMRRAREGGSYHVKVSLTRTSMWVQDLGLLAIPDAAIRGQHFATQLRPVLERRDSPYGILEQLGPVARFSHTPAKWSLPPSPTGAFPARWQS